VILPLEITNTSLSHHQRSNIVIVFVSSFATFLTLSAKYLLLFISEERS